MRKMLRRFLDWLDERFPAKVVVTDAMYRDMDAAYHRTYGEVTELKNKVVYLDAEIGRICESIKALKEAMSRPALPDAARRAAYIATGRMGE